MGRALTGAFTFHLASPISGRGRHRALRPWWLERVFVVPRIYVRQDEVKMMAIRASGYWSRGDSMQGSGRGSSIQASTRGTSMARRRLAGAGGGDAVAPLVLGVAGVAADPLPAHGVVAGDVGELLPELPILDRLARGRPPALALPAAQPLGHAADDVLAVAQDVHLAGPGRQRLAQSDDGRGELHFVIGRVDRSARQLAVRAPGDAHDRAVPARPGVPFRRPVSEYHCRDWV